VLGYHFEPFGIFGKWLISLAYDGIFQVSGYYGIDQRADTGRLTQTFVERSVHDFYPLM
jgi:hypothetical protein